MPKKSKKKGKRPSTSGDAPAKRGSAAPPPPPPAAPDDGPVFDDAFEDEYMEEDVVVGDEGEGEEHARRLIEADMEAETLSNTRGQDPRRNAKGGELDFDTICFEAVTAENIFWPPGTAPPGLYVVNVTLNDDCDDNAVLLRNFTLTIRLNGQIFDILSSSLTEGNSIPPVNFNL